LLHCSPKANLTLVLECYAGSSFESFHVYYEDINVWNNIFKVYILVYYYDHVLLVTIE
jgi:hypothetical protein